MPRLKSRSRSEILDRALDLFWRNGFAASSLDDLVRATGTTRHTLYLEFGNKDRLFEACLRDYSDKVVTPAFAQVEDGNSGLADIAGYFEYQIRRAEAGGLPGTGCLMANTMTERAPHSAEAASLVNGHLDRLQSGFTRALMQAVPEPARSHKAEQRVRDHAQALVVFANGLWSVSRVTVRASDLRRSVGVICHAIEHDLRSIAANS